MNKFHTILLDQASRTVLKNLTVFVKDDINQVKDYKGHFLKVSEGYDNALIKNAQVGLACSLSSLLKLTHGFPYYRPAKTDPRRCRRLPTSFPPPNRASNIPLWIMSTI